LAGCPRFWGLDRYFVPFSTRHFVRFSMWLRA
jgi:hypothetical protein